jgi:hypothetical protein
MGAEAFADPKKAKIAFGFDVGGAGMLSGEVVFDHENFQSLKIRRKKSKI